MMNGYIDSNGNYYEAEKNTTGAVQISLKPSPYHVYVKGAWVLNSAAVLADLRAEKLASLETSRKYFENLRYAGKNDGTSFEITKPDIIQELIIGWIAIKDNPVGTFTVRDDHGVEITFTSTNLNLVMPMISGAKKQAIDKYWQRKAAIENALNETALNAIETNLSR